MDWETSWQSNTTWKQALWPDLPTPSSTLIPTVFYWPISTWNSPDHVPGQMSFNLSDFIRLLWQRCHVPNTVCAKQNCPLVPIKYFPRSLNLCPLVHVHPAVAKCLCLFSICLNYLLWKGLPYTHRPLFWEVVLCCWSLCSKTPLRTLLVTV